MIVFVHKPRLSDRQPSSRLLSLRNLSYFVVLWSHCLVVSPSRLVVRCPVVPNLRRRHMTSAKVLSIFRKYQTPLSRSTVVVGILRSSTGREREVGPPLMAAR